MDTVWIPVLSSVAGGGLTAWIAMRVVVARLEVRVERLEDELGDGDRGLRKRVHDTSNKVLILDGRVCEIEARRRR